MSEKKKHLHTAWIVFILSVVVVGIGAVGVVAYTNSYAHRVLPSVRIGEIPVGGMTREELMAFLEEMNDKLVNEGIPLVVDTQGRREKNPQFTLYPVFASGSNSVELVSVDVAKEVDHLLAYGKDGGIWARAARTIQSRLTKPQLTLTEVTVDHGRIREAISTFVSDIEEPPREATIDVETIEPLRYTIVSSTPGIVVAYEHVPDDIQRSWMRLEFPRVNLVAEAREPSGKEDIFFALADRLEPFFSHGGLPMVYTDERTTLTKRWTISPRQIADWLTMEEDDERGPFFTVSLASTTAFLEEVVAPDITVPAQDAKFDVSESGRVTAFQASRSGVALDIDETVSAIQDAMRARNWEDPEPPESVSVHVEQTEPNITMSEVNDLGITEVLGVGVSDFAGSPANRVKNIQHAVRKLNGILIPPGEEFSTLTHTAPFTLEGGYLPELVIKGDEIKPEIGGGLCQIGSTLFRMAMNSGMPITERRNHSLVVRYYNDLTNGNPGTDATIYDPAPDFKFLNDTGHHVLVQTGIDLANSKLYFTLWGTNDGRKGWYTPPVVDRWIPHGETKFIETTTLAPGVKECQHAYTGADAHFTYIRTLPNGEREERLFESHYRPLPQICLVGVEPSEEETDNGEDEAAGDQEAPAPEDGTAESEQARLEALEREFAKGFADPVSEE